MLPNGKVWIVISCQGVADTIRDEVDDGNFAQAKTLSFKAQALADKLASFVAQKGGHLHLNLLERQIIEAPESVAEELPNILEGYRQDLPGMICVGVGLTFEEASTAMKLSHLTNDIELYDPDDNRFSGAKQYTTKSEGQVTLPINMFDQTVPGVQQHDMATEQQEQEVDDASEQKFITKPGIEEELEAESALVQAIAQILSGGAQQQQQQQAQQPRDLREALEGGPVEGYQPAQSGQSRQQGKPQVKGKPGEKEEKAEADPSSDATDAKLGALLHSVKASLPQIMAMHKENPDAYKSAMNLVQKLVGLTKERRMKKYENMAEDLNKAIRLKLPVGSRDGKWMKVMVNGKEVWRQAGAGLTMDAQGQPVSVKSANKQATGKPPVTGENVPKA